jgi:transcriptional regulator with XRE-family HTH domain
VPRPARQPARDPALKRLGERVRALRHERHISQEALADSAGIARSYMSGIERGVRNCSVLHILRIAKALKVSVGDLFTR